MKAKGVWQFMTGTAIENGLRRDWYIDERSDPEKATVAAAEIPPHAQQDLRRRLAPGAGVLQRRTGPPAARDQDRPGSTDFWKLAEKPKALPRETREYVPMILAAIVIARNPAQYGFDIEPEPQTQFDKVTLPRPVDLRRVAEWTDVTIDDIQALNPELRRWTTPVKDTQYSLKVPAGTGDVVLSRLERYGGRGPGVAEVLYGEERRYAAAHRPQAARRQGRPGRGQLPRRRRRACPPVRS